MSLLVICVDGEFPRARTDVLMGSRYFAELITGRSAEDVTAERLVCEATLAMFRCVYESLAFGVVVTPCCNAEAVLRYYRAEIDDAAVAKAVGDAVASIGAGAVAVAAVDPPPAGARVYDNISAALATCIPAITAFHDATLRKIQIPVRIEIYDRGLFGDLKFTVPAKSRMIAMLGCEVIQLAYGPSNRSMDLDYSSSDGHWRFYYDINRTAFFRNFETPIEFRNAFSNIAPGWVMLVYAA